MNGHGSVRRSRWPHRFPVILSACAGAIVAAAAGSASALQPLPAGIPVLQIETSESTPITSRRKYVKGSVSLSANGSVDATGRPTIETPILPVRIRGRGNTSWEHPKKPLRLRFDSPTDLLGAGAAEVWVLLANYVDPSSLRNATAFELGRRIGMPFTPEARHVYVIVNGTFQGLYLLTEQTEVAPHRVITDDAEGFLVDFDDYDDPDEPIFSTRILDLPLKIKKPNLSDLTADERARAVSRITGLFDHLERTLTAADGPGDYAAIIDVDSFVDWFLTHELTHNYEPRHPKSCFFHRAADGRIAAGPIWDFDWAFDHEQLEPDVLLLKDVAWFRHLFKDPAFTAKVRARWAAIRRGPVDSLPQYVDGLAASIRPAVERDMHAWPLDGDSRVASAGPGLAEWLRTRIRLLDEAIGKL